MIEHLWVLNFDHQESAEYGLQEGDFVLGTCQRRLIASTHKNRPHNALGGTAAYALLLSIISGLESDLQGENEIVAQFKKAYQDYLQSENRSRSLTQILQKLFLDQKQIRAQHLKGICQKTYAALTKKKIIELGLSPKKPILIFGSGQLAQDLIHQFLKTHQVHVYARNTEKLSAWQERYRIVGHDWEHPPQWEKFSYIINTIGASHLSFAKHFIPTFLKQSPSSKAFIDLAFPSCFEEHFHSCNFYVPLEEIMKEGAVRDGQKKEQIQQAGLEVQTLAKLRGEYFTQRALKRAHY